jgi:predicted metal-dependent peptidase
MSAIETKLAAARTRLILDKPFLGALVLRLPLTAADKTWCTTTATDARRFYYNPEYIDALSLDQTQFVLAHEALHCALSHFARRQHRVKHRWDLACDFAVNPLLVDDGLTPPPNAVVMDQYKGMTAEEIYPLLDDDDETETLDEHVYDREQDQGGSQGQTPPPRQDDSDQGKRPDQGGEQERPTGDGRGEDAEPSGGGSPEPDERGERGERGSGEGAPPPPPLTPDERETLAVQWQQRMAGAAQQAMQSGKLGGALARMIDHLLQPQLPWRMLLARYMSTAARDDFSYMRPSRREGDAILPSLRSGQIDVVIGLDTSGSIRESEIEEFMAEVDALKGQVRARVTLLPCDAALAEGAPWVYEPWEEIEVPDSIHGGGGTNFRPVFEWVDHQGLEPELLIYFTDAEGKFPEREPPYPVIWLVKGKENVPWGRRVQLN